jgi:hypothetical protein
MREQAASDKPVALAIALSGTASSFGEDPAAATRRHRDRQQRLALRSNFGDAPWQ